MLLREEAGAPAAAEEEAEEEEPDWELPEHLSEYDGDPTDRKAMLSFRQAQQAARQVCRPCLKLQGPKQAWLRREGSICVRQAGSPHLEARHLDNLSCERLRNHDRISQMDSMAKPSRCCRQLGRGALSMALMATVESSRSTCTSAGYHVCCQAESWLRVGHDAGVVPVCAQGFAQGRCLEREASGRNVSTRYSLRAAQALDKERAQWQAERRRREKAREAERRARSEQEKAKAREKAEAEEAIVQCAPCSIGGRQVDQSSSCDTGASLNDG